MPDPACRLETDRSAAIGQERIDVRFEVARHGACKGAATQPSWTLAGTGDPHLELAWEVVTNDRDAPK